ncbi:HD domain-containing phosphohydrolase [Desulfococcus sp.]|uniref:HD domain-containing phosphohydrolase n=1 Tax=Desulfococcus sp. TaxID=2025834 RepID=UPI003593BEFA
MDLAIPLHIVPPFSPIDDSTGLYAHEVFNVLLDHEIRYFERDGKRCSIAFIDIDFSEAFRVLRQQSEAAVIRKIGDILRSGIRQVDFGARYSYNKFVLAFVNSDGEDAHVALRRILGRIDEVFEGNPPINIGTATCPENGTTRAILVQRAIDALHSSRGEGQNRIIAFDPMNRMWLNNRPKVLIVDDIEMNIKILEAMLRPNNYEIYRAVNGKEALGIMEFNEIDMVLLDIMMPGMNGYEVCRRIKNRQSTAITPVIMVTALDDSESKIKGIEVGADDFITKPPNRNELITRTRSLIKLKTLYKDFTNIESVLFSLARAVEAKNPYTNGHTSRVASLSVAIGTRMNLEPEKIEALRFGGVLHDIGKIGISNQILNKSGSLDDREWQEIKSHPETGFRICYPLRKRLRHAMDVIRHHHEKLDGSGYPDGLAGDEISTVARITAAADIYDALITDRPYRPRMDAETAVAILKKEVLDAKLDKNVVEELQYITGY